MDANYSNIVGGVDGERGGVFNNAARYRVPLYQRHYVWDSINWGHLWDDIEKTSELRCKNVPKTHFLGAIVIQEIIPDVLIDIIDGQQRLTTFQIIFCAIRDLCDEFDADPLEIQKEVGKYICPTGLVWFPRELGHNMRYKLLPREGTDRDVFLSLCEREHEEAEKGSRIWEAYVYFKGKIKAYVNNDYNKLQMLYKSILGDFGIVTIEVTSEDEYAKIFKSINGTGRRLAQFDLLRNDLFLRAKVTNRDDLYKKYWYHFEETPDWRKNEVLDNFLENFLKIKLGEDFDKKFSLFDLYELYCTKLTKELNISETDPKLVQYEFYDLSRYSSIYHELYIADSERIGGQIKFYDEFNDKLDVVDQLKLFILYISNEFELSSSEVNRVFSLFEAYVLRGMLHIGSKGYNLPPLKELNNLFLRALDEGKSLSIVNLLHSLSWGWATDQEVESALRMLPKTEASRKKSKSKLMREFGGRYIFDVLGWEIDHLELFDRFCEKWPSPEVVLQKELIGDLPIVYSKIPISIDTIGHLGFDSENPAFEQAMPRLENYVFVTYQDTIELSEYETDENSITGVEVSSAEDEILVLKEILFAFPKTAMSSMQSHINHIQNYPEHLGPQPELKEGEETFSTKNWLFEEISGLQTRVENSNDEHWLLSSSIGTIIVVTRGGHELQGKLKSFSDKAIYMEINEHIVTVYMHGIYELKRKTHIKKGNRGRRKRLA